ncbi:MAG: type IV secretion system DNA-binding domain-containing protein, partial [Simkaniaceae bacterium]|nr:type IV secretion system DNA-binding domain-containing protein [Simkaniaceae bacterium]
YYRENQDILFNPYDTRTSPWHPWCECHKDYHYEQIVNSLIPNTQFHSDDFFLRAGRAVLLATLEESAKNSHNIKDFLDFLLKQDIHGLHAALKDTDASVYVDPKGERTTMSIRATIANIVRHFRSLKNTTSPFSIRDWILSETIDNQWLFLTCTTEQRASLNPLMSVWFSVAMNAMKAKDPKLPNKKIWFIIDELHSLQKLEYLEESLAELRKYGGCIVLATQDLSQIDKQYGSHSTRTIIDLCGTKVCFRQSDNEIAKRMSSFFGETEYQEMQEGLSYGAHEMRDGVNLSKIERTKPTVPATKILELQNLQAYLKLPGNHPATKIKFKYQTLAK